MGTNSIYGAAQSAADNTTKISYGQVRTSVDNIQKSSQNMQTIFDNFRMAVKSATSDDVFKGVASEAAEEKFDALQKKFDLYTDAVTRFAQCIESARAQTEAMEQNLRNKANNLAA